MLPSRVSSSDVSAERYAANGIGRVRLRLRQLPFGYAVRNLSRSRVRLFAALLGSSLVVLLILASAGFARGMQQSLTQWSGLRQNVLLVGAGSEESLERSQIDASVAGIAAASIPGIRSEAGVILASPEINTALPVRRTAAASGEPVPEDEALPAVVRGVRPVALLVHPEVEIVAGRFPEAGANEIMVGQLAATRLGIPDADLAIGRTLELDRRAWTIVGRFRAPQTVMDAELWFPITDVQVATKREQTISSVVLTLDTGGRLSDVEVFALSRLDLELAAIPEAAYYASLADFYRPIRIMVIVTAVLIAIGGILGGLNTMYAAFAARIREVGMLQSLGFTRPAIIANILEESLFIAACGGMIGSVIGLVLLDGLAVRFSMGAFALVIDAPVMLLGLLGGLAVGVFGAIPPAIRCLRLPIPQALKAS